MNDVNLDFIAKFLGYTTVPNGALGILPLRIWLRRGNKAVCGVVKAKKYNIEQGMAQDLVSCEVAAEIGDLDVVHGIVTNYIQWTFFLRNRNDVVEMEECSLRLTPNGPDRESLKEIVEKDSWYALK